jgi:arylsulfatase A-like enzyme
VKGNVSHELYHVVDLLPTLVHGIAGIDLAEALVPKEHAEQQPPPPPLDGVDVWASISTGAPSPRMSALLQLDPLSCYRSARVRRRLLVFEPDTNSAVVRRGRFTLVVLLLGTAR